MATGIPRSGETQSPSPMTRLNERAVLLTNEENPHVINLEGIGVRISDYTDESNTTYAVIFKLFDGQMTAQISKPPRNRPSAKKEVVESYFWDPEDPENPLKQFFRNLTGFGDEEYGAIGRIISVVEYSPRPTK